jgi:glycosyltransferase involved in cell wall biosynthesis
MKIAIVSDEHFPHTGADTEVIVSTAAALGARGADVTLVVPRLWRRRQLEAICGFYGVRPTFRLAPVLGWPAPSRSFRIEKAFHGFLATLHAAVRRADVVHSRDVLPLAVAHLTGRPWSFETYRLRAAERPWLPRVLRRARLERGIGAVAHSEASRSDLVALGFPEEAVVTARPGFAMDRFEPALSRAEARRLVGLPPEGAVVAYAGNIHASKGVEQLLDVARRLPAVTCVVVGGTAADVQALAAERDRRGLGNVTLAGHCPPSRVAPYLFAADVLFAPFLAETFHAGRLARTFGARMLPGTPLKLYSYLAAGRPIVAGDYPQNRELLREEENALFFPGGRPDLAAGAVSRLLADPALAGRLGRRGRDDVRKFTWDERARVMLAFFERRLSRAR